MLTLAATPIGNLEDCSLRLARVLKEADHVFAEDTRHSAKLLAYLGIEKKLQAFHDHSPPQVLARLEKLIQTDHVVYISDAGTPAINDPGFELVRSAHRLGVPVDALPGPCAAINGLILSGLPTHAFCFLGFFPQTQEKRQKVLARLRTWQITAIFYEAPTRIHAALNFMAQVIPQTQLALCREMTKLHQEVLRGTAGEILASLKQTKGEMVLIIAPVTEKAARPSMEARFQELLKEGTSPAAAAKILAREYGGNKRDIYQKLVTKM